MGATFDHVHIYSADPEVALKFWQQAMGAEPVGDLGDVRLLILGGQFLAISAFPEGNEPAEAGEIGDGAFKRGLGVAHVGINVDDIQALLPRLEAHGAVVHTAFREGSELRGAPSDPGESSPLRYVYFTAPDGVIVELTQYVLPRHLVPAARALSGFNRAVHIARRSIGRALVRAAG